MKRILLLFALAFTAVLFAAAIITPNASRTSPTSTASGPTSWSVTAWWWAWTIPATASALTAQGLSNLMNNLGLSAGPERSPPRTPPR
jgi:hypothetical protein